MAFIDKIKQIAKNNKRTIVLPESGDLRTLEACAKILKEGIANVVLIGNEDEIKAKAGSWDIGGAKIIEPATSEYYEKFADKFYEMRKSKGVTPEQAKETMLNPLYFGVMLVNEDICDGMVAGACNSTSNVLRPSLQILKTAPGTKLVSAFFMMCVPDCDYGDNGVFLFADSGLYENPNADDLSEIAISSAKSFKQLTGAEPIVAMLSYSTYGSAKSELVEKVSAATKSAKEKAPSLLLDGELLLDAAIVPEVGQSKAPGSPVAGKANVLVFPDLNAGNIGYKLVQRLAKAEAYGPITQGIKKPVNDLSRGCVADDIVGVAAITAVQSMN
jgi:phosphate acetyltransferase